MLIVPVLKVPLEPMAPVQSPLAVQAVGELVALQMILALEPT